MKEVVFREYRQIGVLICGIFALLGFFVMLFVFLTNMEKINFYCIFILLCLFMGVVLIISAFNPSKEGIKSIKIDNYHMLIKAYGEDKKEVDTDILLKDISAFKFNMKYERICIFDESSDIIINVYIELKNEQRYEYEFHTVDNAKIKQMFSIAKYIPKFSYNVDTNSQWWKNYIVNSARKAGITG